MLSLSQRPLRLSLRVSAAARFFQTDPLSVGIVSFLWRASLVESGGCSLGAFPILAEIEMVETS
jgi:hypothetical protein